MCNCNQCGCKEGMNMSVYAIQDRETGTRIDIFDTLEEAERTLKEYENDDIEEGVYMAHFYEIVEVKE